VCCGGRPTQVSVCCWRGVCAPPLL